MRQHQFDFVRSLCCSIYSNFCENSLLKRASQPQIAKNSLKPAIFRFQGRSMSSMLVPPESSSALVVMIRINSVSICNHSRAGIVGSSRNRTFSMRYPNLMHSYGGLLEPRWSNLTPLSLQYHTLTRWSSQADSS